MRGAVATGNDQRRHGGEVIGIARVPQTEQNGDCGDDEERRAVRDGRDLVVEPEHRYLTLGSAWSVIATPATRITTALRAGSRETSLPSKLNRRKGRGKFLAAS